MPHPTAEAVSAAVRAHQSLGLRSENHKAYGALFVDIDDLHVFDTPDWQVAYGRKGTGKTFLLRVLEQRLRASLEISRVLPVYISAHDLLASPLDSADELLDDRRSALASFQIFLDQLLTKVVETSGELLGRSSFTRTLRGDPQRTATRANEVRDRLLQRATQGVPVDAYLESDFADVQTSVEHRERGKAGNASATISPANPGVQLSGGLQGSTSASTTHEGTIARKGPTVYRLDGIRSDLDELASLLRIERVVILIDEWSALDPTATKGVQPWFGTLLKRALGNTPTISVKIATSRYQTRFVGQPGEPTGLEPGADIFVALNLDRAQLSQDALEEFFATMLFKRLLLKESRMSGFALRDGRASRRFVTSIFKDRAAFEDLVVGSEGNPRNFLVTFDSVARERRWSVTPRWTRVEVQKSVREQAISGLEPVGVMSDAGRLLETFIEQAVRRRGSRGFAVLRTEAEPWDQAVEELLERRLIRETATTDAGKSGRGEKRRYQLAYGLWLDLERTSEVGENNGSPPVGESTADIPTIDLSEFNSS
jgi:hypothetical protein